MYTPANFLDAARAGDETALLIFADWLAEQADDRSMLVRLLAMQADLAGVVALFPAGLLGWDGSYTFTAADAGKVILFNGANDREITLPANLTDEWFVTVGNMGSGLVTIRSPDGHSIALASRRSVSLFSDGQETHSIRERMPQPAREVRIVS